MPSTGRSPEPSAAAVLPMSVAARGKRILASRWDRMEVPWPFTRVHLGVADPIDVPPDLDPADVRTWSGRVAAALEALDERLEREVRSAPAGATS